MNRINSRLFILCILLATQGYSSFFAIAPSIKEKIEIAQACVVDKRLKHMSQCDTCSYNRRNRETLIFNCNNLSQITLDHYNELEAIVSNAGSLMSAIEKLTYLRGDQKYPQRKEIIKTMITNGTHPNKIVYQQYEDTPLYESVVFQDLPFALYLVQHGATFDKKTINFRPEFVALVQQKAAENALK